MTLLTPPQTPARFGLARFGGFRFGYVRPTGCAKWTNEDPVQTTWTSVSPCVNTGA